MEIFLRKNVIENNNLSDDGLIVYVALRKLMNKDEKEYYVSYNMIAYILYGNTNFNKRFISHIKEGLQNLIDMKLIRTIPINKTSTIGKNEFILDLSKLFFKTDNTAETKDYFIKIYTDEVHKIMQSKKDKFNLLKCFINTVGSFDYGAKVNDGIEYVELQVGYMPQEYLGKLCEMVQVDYYKYSVELENLGVLYIKRNEDFYLDDDIAKRMVNCYGRPCDKELIDKYSVDYAIMKGSAKVKCNKRMTAEKANHKKSLAMKFNEIIKGKRYSDAEMKEIYEYCSAENEKYEKEIEGLQKESYLSLASQEYLEKLESKVRDLTILDDLIEEETKKDIEEDNTEVRGDYNPMSPFGLSDDELDELY